MMSSLDGGLANFAFAAQVAPSRRSPRKRPLPKPDDDEDELHEGSSSHSPPSKRKKRGGQLSLAEDHRHLSRSPTKLKRVYAAPETYAHLNVLQDHLRMHLDIMFCGINPGCKSAKVGHHFANPTNHFWRCLYQSGLTSRLLLPTEDLTLPEQFDLGLTNLVDRPSAEAELSKAEMVESVPAFIAKVTRYSPRIVCFVGVGIWDIVERAMKSMVQDAAVETRASTGRPRATAAQKPKRMLCLQRYKLVHADVHPTTGVAETFFFVVPSTSGRVVSHQLQDKVKLFAELKRCLDDLTESRVDTKDMIVVPVARPCEPPVVKEE